MAVMGAVYDVSHKDFSMRSVVASERTSTSQPGRCFSQGQGWRRPRRRKRSWISPGGMINMLVVLLIMVSPAYAALVQYENCLQETIRASNPMQLQFVPLDVDVTFDLKSPLHGLNITVYGNVSGTADRSRNYPSADNSSWSNPNNTVGKIPDLDTSTNTLTTLYTSIKVLSFTPYNQRSRFCDSVLQGSCPLAPVFNVNASDLTSLRSFSIDHDMLSTYRFASMSSTLRIRAGDAAATELGCVSLSITPDLGSPIRNALTYTPLVILILVGIATIAAAMYSPWGSTDPFRWTSNYGRDEDVLRLVTPGFADCLQYLQFAVLTGALSLDYPGYYQPVVSRVAWSSLMFNQSFVGPGRGLNPVIDGVYAVNATYGLDRLNQLVGMEAAKDIWPGMMVWLLVVVVATTLLIQLAFALRWLHREIANVPEEDLRAKNMPFTVGNVIRIVFNYLFLPLISLSFFQLVIARQSPAYSVALAVIVILVLICFTIWIIRLIASTRPKSYLFDDLSTVLLYGPLYNTYCDDAAAFALVPIFITFTRGIAIGALQPSGIAQLVLLAICEVVTVLTLVAFRPFPAPTSMNFYHGCLSFIRFVTILLSVTFVPSLGVSEVARGWIGYVILGLHALVLVFAFFLNALQTLIEVIARLAGAGGNQGGATRGGLTKVFGMRQLSRRVPRRDVGTRQSMGSEAAMLGHTDDRMSSQFEGSRPRSLSGNSAFLLNRAAASDGRASMAFEGGSTQGGTHSRANSSGLYTPTTPGGGPVFQGAGYQTTGSNSPKSSTVIGMQPHDPYYRPPRPRRRTMETGVSVDKGRGAFSSVRNAGENDDDVDGPSVSGRATPVPAYIPAPKEDLDYDDNRQSRTDYAVREVDFYYRVRGPPLSQSGTRKLKTGPADPTGPVSSATGWFRNLFQGKTKEKGKGFEVVRSSRAPPPGLLVEGEEFVEPYRDDPDQPATGNHSRQVSETNLPYRDSDGEELNRNSGAPVGALPGIDTGGSIELPSRMGSRSSAQVPPVTLERPSIPRKSSRRQSSVSSMGSEMENMSQQQSLAVVAEPTPRDADQPNERAVPARQLQPSSSSGTGRLPFTVDTSVSRNRNVSIASTTASTSSSQHVGQDGSMNSRVERPSSVGFVPQHRARDNIHEGSPDEPSFKGSAAELVNEPLH